MTYRPFFARAKKSHIRPLKGKDKQGNPLIRTRTRASVINVNAHIDDNLNPEAVPSGVSKEKSIPNWNTRMTKLELLSTAHDLGVKADDSLTKAKIVEALDASVLN